MLIPSLLLLGGILLLGLSAEWLVRGASALGRAVGIPPIVIGLTVVSIGTSAPELVVSVLAALRGSPDLAAGNVFGSNLANVGLILGIAALVQPLAVSAQAVRREVPWMMVITIVVFPLLWNLRVGAVEGAVLASTLGLYLFFLIRIARRDGPSFPHGPAVAPSGAASGRAAGPKGGPWGRPLGIRVYLVPTGLVVAGAVGLVVGGRGIVAGATTLASALGISEIVIGLSVVAVGTSLPELATTVVAAVRREADLAVGNIVGSNIFNLTFVLGGTALISPLAIDPLLLRVEYPAMLILSLVLLPLAWTRRALARWEGLLLLALYGASWTWILLMRGA